MWFPDGSSLDMSDFIPHDGDMKRPKRVKCATFAASVRITAKLVGSAEKAKKLNEIADRYDPLVLTPVPGTLRCVNIEQEDTLEWHVD